MGKAAKAAQALAAALDAFYRMMVAFVMGLLALIGIAPKGTGGGLARVVAEEMATVAEEPRSDLGEAVKARALQLRGMAPPNLLVPLPAPIEAWLQGLTPADLQTVTTMPSSTVEQHVTSGEAGALRSLGYVLPMQLAPARPVSDTPSVKAAAAVDLAHRFDVQDLVARLVPTPTLRPR